MLLPTQVTEQKNTIKSKVIWITFKTYHANFQKEKTNTVSAAIGLGKVKGKLRKLKKQGCKRFQPD